MEQNSDRGLKFAISLLALGLIIVFFPFNILNGISLGNFTISISEYDKLGAFISGLTAPFISTSAFILLFLTYRSQKQELAASKEILNKQSDTLEKQQFETTFFNLLNLHHSIVNSTDVKVPESGFQSLFSKNKGLSAIPDIRNGRDCFTYFYELLENYHLRTKKQFVEKRNEHFFIYDNLIVIKEAYSKFYSEFQYDLGHYFRNLYHIVKFVHNSSIQNKKEYVSLIRAQISSHELLVLFYNGLADHGDKFKPLIEEYHFLKNMPQDAILDNSHLSLYHSSAYGK